MSFEGDIDMESALAALENSTLSRPQLIQKLAFLLPQCRKDKNAKYIDQLRDYIHRKGLQTDASLGNFLVPLLAAVGPISDAQDAFDQLVLRSEHSWNSLIIGYARCGKLNHAFDLYVEMNEASEHPNARTFVALLNACSKLEHSEKGLQLHMDICRKGLNRDPFVGSSLVDMYSKCGFLSKAQEVFNNLICQDVVTWTALISGFIKHGYAKEALLRFEKMQSDGIVPNVVTYICSLKSCGSLGDISTGQKIHAEVLRRGFGKESFIGSSLVDMYVKFGLLHEAQEVFDMLDVRDTVSYNALIAGYVTQGYGEETLRYFDLMRRESISFTSVTYASFLRACGSTGAIDKGHMIHTDIFSKGLQNDLIIGNALVDMYVTLGSLASGTWVFEKLPRRDVISWTSLIAGYAKQGHGGQALQYFEDMLLEGASPNSATYVCSLMACCCSGDIDKGMGIHAEVARKGLAEDLLVGSTLIDMYAKSCFYARAQEVFCKLPVRDVVCWNALQGAYFRQGYDEEAVDCFQQMQFEDLSPDAVTIVCSLKGCANLGAIEKGQEIHCNVIKSGLQEKDHFVSIALVDMYAKCGLFTDATATFLKLPSQDTACWNALITGYIQHGQGKAALLCFDKMQSEGILPDIVTFVCYLKACNILGTIERAQEVHIAITERGLETDLLVANALVDMYVTCGLLHKAQEIFDNLLCPDVVSWTALISGYAKHGYAEEALAYFNQMQYKGLVLDALVYVCILKACSSIGATEEGLQLHGKIVNQGLDGNLVVANSLVDMYASCGMIMEAQEVFGDLASQDVISYTALLSGYAQLGESRTVLDLLAKMIGNGEAPNSITFVSVLNACSHSGLVEWGQVYFELMNKVYGIISNLEHYMCMVDIFGRAGQLDKAMDILENMPFHPNLMSLHSLLGASRKWNDVDIGRLIFEHAVNLDENDAAVHVCMYNIYADARIYEPEKIGLKNG